MRPPVEGPCKQAFGGAVEIQLRGERVRELSCSRRPPRRAVEEGVVGDRVNVKLSVLCRGVCIDYVRNAAAGRRELSESVVVELAGDVKVVVLLECFDGGYEGVVEFVVQRWCIRVRDVAKMVEVVFDVG